MARDEDDEGVSFEDAVVEAATDKALLIKSAAVEKNGSWIPRSVVLDDSEISADAAKGDTGTITVKTWWAEKNGLG